MGPAEIIEMSDFEKHYWWHKGKLYLIEVFYNLYLKPNSPFKSAELSNSPGSSKSLESPKNTESPGMGITALEIGCGTGEVMRLIKNWGTVTGMDISQTAVDYCKNAGFRDLILGDINTLPVEVHRERYDLIVCLDVLEHIDNDIQTIKRIHTMLKPGGYFFVTVPAYKFLWSNHDEALNHRRRYHSLEIKQKLKDSGFNIMKCTHFVAFLFPVIAFVRLMSNFVRRTAYPKTSYMNVPEFINTLFTRLLKAEAVLVKYINLPFGSTLAVAARKSGLAVPSSKAGAKVK